MASSASPRAAAWARPLSWVALCASGALLALVLLVVGRPLATPDLWFHLKAGETYFHEGLWPAIDPMLFTGLPGGPVQHEWLFGVFAYLLERALGLSGLRLAHMAMVLAIVMLLARAGRRASGSWQGAALGLTVFLVLAWPRLVQFRPDLWTVAAAIALHDLALSRDRGPSARALGALLVLQLLWSNAHSLAAIGVVLTAAAALGAAFERGIVDQTVDVTDAQRDALGARTRRLALAVPLLVVVGLAHPRGVDQLLTFFLSSADTAIWEIHDEWSPFDPFSHAGNLGPVSLLSWLVTDAVLLGFGLLSASRLRALRSERSTAALRRLDPPAFIAAAAACGALLISMRFLWMALFPLLYLLSALPALWQRRPRLAALMPAVVIASLLALTPGAGGLSAFAADMPKAPRAYLETPVTPGRFAEEAAQFMRDAGVSGRLFCPYELGAYYGYQLAPRVRTFIDSRTEHYSAEVFAQWKAITTRQPYSDGRDFLQLLDDREVDLFFGVGVPGYGYSLPYTLAHLDGQPGWVRVYRSAGQVVYLRALPRNQDNLERIARYYEAAGVAFDRHLGLDVGQLLERNLPWALSQHVVPADFAALRKTSQGAARRDRIVALISLADMRFVAGDYTGAARDARAAMDLGARGARPAEVIVAALQRAGEPSQAQAFLETLARDHGTEAWAREFLQRFTRAR